MEQPDQLDQLQLEWIFVVACRELLSIVRKNPNVKYSEAVEFAKHIDGDKIFSKSTTEFIGKELLDKLYERYKELAIAKTAETGKEVSPKTLIIDRFEELTALLKGYPKDAVDPKEMKKERRDLNRLLDRDKPIEYGLRRITENKALMHDSYAIRRGQLFINSSLARFNEYLNEDDDSIFRIAVLHPDQSETITGADLIYEQYDEAREKVRITALQYKIYENERIYLSKSPNLLSQVEKLKASFCDKKYCCNEKGDPMAMDLFRFPFCAAFLRPTDKLQNPDNLITSGYHFPICKMEKLWENSNTNYKIKVNKIKNLSIKTSSFEELFNKAMVGSRWLDISELEDLYKKSKILEPSERIMLYAQSSRRERNLRLS